MSNADELRLAARRMREQHGPEHKRHEMWFALAGLLDATCHSEFADERVGAALAVARAYLRDAA